MQSMWEKYGERGTKTRPSVPADIWKRFSVLLLNCYSQAILMSGCFFKKQSSRYLNQAGAGICAPQLTISLDGEACNCLNPDGLKYSSCGRSSPWRLSATFSSSRELLSWYSHGNFRSLVQSVPASPSWVSVYWWSIRGPICALRSVHPPYWETSWSRQAKEPNLKYLKCFLLHLCAHFE